MTKVILSLKCSLCSTTIQRDIGAITQAMKKGQKYMYCSRRCFGKHNTLLNTTEISCTQCGKKVIRKICLVKVVKNPFCFCKCAAKYNNPQQYKGSNRSKLEKYLEQQLVTLFPILDIRFNNKDTIGSELDIYIPQLRLGIELNGIHHYKPIYGEKKFKSIQNYDSLKIEACSKQLITLVIIDTTKQRRCNPKSSQVYLDTICEIIDSYKLS
jgi:hypothetical protein